LKEDMAKIILKFAVAPLLVILSACTPWQTAERGDIMALKGTIPPMDAAAPTQTETATFALG
jgi:hypothetical protein